MNGRPLRLLVADDNENVRRTLRKLLSSEADFEVVCEAINGAEAVSKATEYRPDVVLLDITMPTMDGLEAARILKRELPSIQIIIVSQHDSRGFKWSALAAGVNGYVVKGDAARDLIPELRRIQGLGLSA